MPPSITKAPNHETIQSDPFRHLGPHPEPGGGFLVRAFHPAATAVEIRTASGELTPMTRVGKDADGLYEARISDASDYRLVITYPGGQMLEVDDPYRYGRVLTDFDLHLLNEGTHHR